MRLLDSNVWLAALNADERDHVAARRLIEGAIERPLAALDLTLYEVANVAMKRWRSPARARAVATLVRDACPQRIGIVDAELLERAVALSAEHRLTIYDAAYVAASELHGWTLVSGDHADLVEPGHAITAEQALSAGY
ncbi:MAG TPA: type II toxin-antitoxin system VapC family toxin [Conexibacter sp.]|nr:type II toxin-antitoxin system VapC family toxin [Conexibacter sp.]